MVTQPTERPSQADDRLALSAQEVGKKLGISTRKVYDLVAEGKLKGLKLGKRIVIPKVALDKLVNDALEN